MPNPNKKKLTIEGFFSLFVFILLLQSCEKTNLNSSSFGSNQPLWVQTFVSPNILGSQGYTWDGHFNYLNTDSTLYKMADDSNWTILDSNSQMLTEFPEDNHMGAGTYYNGLLYYPIEHISYVKTINKGIIKYIDTGLHSNEFIGVFDTGSLQFLRMYNISKINHDVSALTINNNKIEIASYWDGNYIYEYNLNGLFLDSIRLQRTIGGIQGITYNNGDCYISTSDSIFQLESNRRNVRGIGKATGLNPEGEGIEMVNGVLRWLIVTDTGSNVYYYSQVN